MTKQDKGRPRIKGLGRSDSFKVIDGVRYIQDEEADMRQLRYHLKMRGVRKAREEKYTRIVDHCKGLLRLYPCDAQTIAAQCQISGMPDVAVNDVRNALKSPEALQAFDRVRSPIGRVEFICKGEKGLGAR